ncbi:5'-3' DNA helicase ZGRF1-like [Babylonia areolata]|uniref:5'-3' DNA helicase ZGRF1-like n=1 Tax=Babylonia areolata TaxID=304850 RepID=UPI003FD6027A
MCSTSTASSPGIVIANDGLDYGEELEDDLAAAKQDNDQSQIFLTEQNHNMKDVQRQKKISRFASGSSVSQCVLKEAVTRNTATARTVGLGKFRRPGVTTVSGCLPNSQFQSSLCHELQFCGREEVERQATPVRQVVIPPSFQSVVTYKQVLTASLTEFLNIQLFTVAKMYHCALSKVDLSAYIEGVGTEGTGGSSNPACKCGSASKVAQVKKEGPNKGRFFYACSAPRDKQCKFFQWVDQQSGSSASRGGGSSSTSMTRPKFSDPASIMGYFRGQGLVLHCQCQFVRRTDNPAFKFGFHKWARPQQSDSVQKKNVFIKLLKKDSAATHAKDDLWVVSKSLRFAKGETFVARSTFHGPNTHGEVAVDPVAGYSASLWTDGSVCHAVHCGNAATELTCMANIQDHVDTTSLPLLPHLLSCQPGGGLSNRAGTRGFKVPTVQQAPEKLYIPAQFVLDLAAEFITRYQLNGDQAQAVRQAASMMDKDAETPSSILLIHGVFGAGKSFLLSVMILFLVEVFQRNDSYCPGVPFPWKLLLSSTTNVAVDRVLLGLMELGFDDFVRVGSVKKIAKPVLPYSMHASGSDNQELKDLQEMLKSQDITSAEKHCIRRSIERHRLGENRKRLGAVRVVGVTCAACSFQCLDKMKFPFVILDECSQMTEPASLLPIARSACEKLVLVGDPKQLDPTLQGSEAAHGEGLEQTLLDRLIKMGHSPVILRTQYRCHPTISAVSNSLFYQGQLVDGVSADTRQPVLDLFPTLCFYDVSNGEEMTDSSGSFTNEAEAQFVGLLLSVIMVHGLQPASVGVITLYKAQARRILDIIRHSKGDAQQELIGVQVSTVDAFQGGERDIIILSCVRTRSVGFIDSDKRMNVALTRARHHMLIVGHQKNLYGNKRWAQVLSHCQAVAGGVVSAISARRQLQAAMDRMQEEDQHSMSCEPPDQGAADQPQPKAARKRKATFQKGSAEDLTARDKSSPPKSKTSSPALYVESEDTPCSSSDQLEAHWFGTSTWKKKIPCQKLLVIVKDPVPR